MALILRRETFIALRARRQAHRIASDIINPHIEDTRPADEPKTPITIKLPPLVKTAARPLERWTMLVAIAIAIGLLTGMVLTWLKVY